MRRENRCRTATLAWCSLAAVVACSGDPELRNLRCSHGEDACQADRLMFTLELSVDFEDAEGDLGEGLAYILVDGERQSTMFASALFVENGLPLDARSGTLAFDLELAFPKVETGTNFEVGIEVEDTEGNRSNDPAIEFQISAP